MREKKYPYQNLSLKDIKGEVWEDIPDFTDYYQVSNFGRIKSLERWTERSPKGDMLLKERILKQSLFKKLNPYTKKYTTHLTVSLCRNASKNTVKAARLVYYLFVKKFDPEDPTLVVVPKDGDPLSLYYKNLKLVQKGDVQLKVYKENQKKKLFKNISQYNQHGHLIATYPSIIQAAEKTGHTITSISQAANGHATHCGGYLWKFGKRKKIKAVKFPYRHVKRIAQYTPEGKFVRFFFSISEAERITGFDDMGIRNTAKKRRFEYKGFVWKYMD